MEWWEAPPPVVREVLVTEEHQYKIRPGFYPKNSLSKSTEPKPRIYRKFYPELNRSFWRVSKIPKKFLSNPTAKERWKKAHEFVLELNRK